MDADERIKQRKRPEADERQLMRVERIAHADREEIVDEHVAGRRDPQADDVVDVKTVECGAVDARDRVGQDEAAQNQIERRPDESPDEIPERDVKRRLEALTDGDQELRGGGRGDYENRNFGEERQLARFEPVILAEPQPDETGHQADVPHPGQPARPTRPDTPNAAQPRHQIVAFADEQRSRRPP